MEHKRNSWREGRKRRKVLNNKIPRRLQAVDEKCNSQVDSCPSCHFNTPYTASEKQILGGAGRKRMQLEANCQLLHTQRQFPVKNGFFWALPGLGGGEVIARI